MRRGQTVQSPSHNLFVQPSLGIISSSTHINNNNITVPFQPSMGFTASSPITPTPASPIKKNIFNISKFQSAAKATAAIARPVSTFTRTVLVRQVSNSSVNGDDDEEVEGEEDNDNGGYKSSVNTGNDSP
jgi:hypothetical protein